jgi:hypothetical protein
MDPTSLTGLAGPASGWIEKALRAVLGDRPALGLWPERLGANVYMHLSVTNRTAHKIHVRAVTVRPAMFLVWRDASAEAAGDAMAGLAPSFIMDPGETRYLPMLAVDRRDEHADHPVEIRVSWRSLQHPRRWTAPAKLMLTHREFEKVHGAA